MQQHFEAAAMRFQRDFGGVFVAGQDGKRDRIVQGKNSLRGGTVAAEIIQQDRQPGNAARSRRFAAGRRCAGVDFDFVSHASSSPYQDSHRVRGVYRLVLGQLAACDDLVEALQKAGLCSAGIWRWSSGRLICSASRLWASPSVADFLTLTVAPCADAADANS